jgi:hypothetical protein
LNVRTTRRRRILGFAVLSAACLSLGIRPQVLEVGRSGPTIWVHEGELVRLQYTQSMYAVPVEERFRVESNCLVLFEVVSSDAALEYLGIEAKGACNARNVIKEFFIPADSVGGYRLSTAHRLIDLADLAAENGRIRVRLTRQPLVVYLIHHWWKLPMFSGFGRP